MLACAPPRLASRLPRRRALISLTPLIDVVFILLIFFMLASSFIDQRAIALDAPGRATGTASIDGSVLVDVREDGPRVAGRPVALSELGNTVAELRKQRPEARVLVRPAAGVPLQDAVRVLDRLAAAGIDGISLTRERL